MSVTNVPSPNASSPSASSPNVPSPGIAVAHVKRTRGYLIWFFAAPFAMAFVLLPGAMVASVIEALGVSHSTVRDMQGYLFGASSLAVMYWLSRSGMTIRHFVAGYRIEKKNGEVPNFFALYLRELFSFGTLIMLAMKTLLPAMMKRSLNGMGTDDDHLVVVNNSVIATKGEVRDAQMHADINSSVNNEMARYNDGEEYLHDGVFGTRAVEGRRRDVFKSKRPARPAPEVQTMKNVA